MGRIIRRMLHRLIRGLWRVRLVVAVLLGLGIVAAAMGSFQAPSLSIRMPGPSRAPDSTENYLKGNQSYNAELMWSALSDDAVDRGRARGEALAMQQRQLDVARERGIKMEQIDYVGGHPLPDGTSLQFYVVGMRGLSSRTDLEFVTYIFTLDRTGKIARIQ
jgi:hypothetical protein